MNANTESLHQGANNRLYTKSTDFARKYVKKKDAARDLKRTTLCVKHDGANVMAWACLAAS